MSETLQIWLFVLTGGGLVALACTGAGFVLSISIRMTRIEAVFELMGQRAAKALHRDDDKYHMDALLDKYLDRHYELTLDEWRHLLERCTAVEKDMTASDKEHIFAAWLGSICEHKLLMTPRNRHAEHFAQAPKSGLA